MAPGRDGAWLMPSLRLQRKYDYFWIRNRLQLGTMNLSRVSTFRFL
jgi:hypothetical protein